MAENIPLPVMLLNRASLFPLPGRGQANADYLRGFATCIEACGARANELLEPFGLDGLEFDRSKIHLSCNTVVDLLESSSRKINDSLLGLRLAQAQEPDILGCAIPLARAAPDFGSAIDQ